MCVCVHGWNGKHGSYNSTKSYLFFLDEYLQKVLSMKIKKRIIFTKRNQKTKKIGRINLYQSLLAFQ